MAEEWLEEEPGDEDAWMAALAAANARAQAEAEQPEQQPDAQDEEARERAKALKRRERARRALASFESQPVPRIEPDPPMAQAAALVAPVFIIPARPEPVAAEPIEAIEEPEPQIERPASVEIPTNPKLQATVPVAPPVEVAPFQPRSAVPALATTTQPGLAQDAPAFVEDSSPIELEDESAPFQFAEQLFEDEPPVEPDPQVPPEALVVQTIIAPTPIPAEAEAPVIAPEPLVEPDEPDQPELYEEPIEAVTNPQQAAAAGPSLDATELVALLRAGRLILCAGPRLIEGRPTFVELIGKVMQSLPFEETGDVWPVLERNPLAAAGFVRRKLGAGFGAALARATDGLATPRTVERLGALPFRAVVTTAYDDVLEQAFEKEGRPLRVYTPGDAATLLEDGKLPFVLKALGSAGRAETVIWSSEDLHTALGSTPFRTAAHELYKSRTFLFVGFERGDLDLAILLERVLHGAAAGEQIHFALLPGLNPVERDELFHTWRIRVLDERDLPTLLESLEAGLAQKEAEGLPPPDDADAWLQILTDDPRNAEANQNLDRVCAELRENEDYERLADVVIGRAAGEPEAARRAELLLTVARVFEHEADDPVRALTTLLAAYKEDPSLAAWHEVERLTSAADAWNELSTEFADVVAVLPAHVRVQLWRKLERHRDLVQALDERVARPDGDDVRKLRLEAAAILAGPLDDRVRAIARYEALLVETPRDLSVLRALEKLYERDGRQEAHMEILERQAAVTPDPISRAALLRRLAMLWQLEADGRVRAIQFWEKLLALEPEADDALQALEQLYQAEERWPELVETLRKRAQLAGPTAKAELYVQIGSLYESEMGDVENALEAFRVADETLSTDESAAALTRLYEQTGKQREAVELLEKRAERAKQPRDRIVLLCRAGEILGDLRDARGAEERFTRVLELDPSYAPAMTALAAIYRQNGEFLRAAKFLVEAVEHTVNRLERTRLYIQAAEMYERIDDPIKAISLYRATLEEDPEHPHAAERAADLLWATQRYEELVPVLELLSRKEASPNVIVERLARLGKAARSIGDEDKADKAYARAAELDPTHLEAQQERANYHLKRDQFAEALQALDKVFQYHIDRLPADAHVELFSQMGRCELMLGAREGARELLQRALEIDPTHRPSLLAQMELAEEPSALIEAKRALIQTATPDEQARLLGEIGDLYQTRLKDGARALAAWKEALERKPDDHRILHKCLDSYVEDKAWPEALGVLDHLIDVERSATVRARYHLTAGLICRDEINRRDLAAGHLRAALESDPDLERATSALETLLQSGQEWKELARFYRAQLKRVGPELAEPDDGKNQDRLRVWGLLGELCWEKLNERESALAALEVALTFDPNNLERWKRIADLYVQAGPRWFEKSIAAHQRILQREKNRILSYKALKHLYIQTAHREKSVLCSYALTVLRKSEPDDQKKVAEYRRRPFALTRRKLGDDAWLRVLHPDEDRLLDALFALVGSTIAAGQAQPHKSFGLNRKNAIDLDDKHSYNKALRYVATVLDVPIPEAYERPDQKEPVVFCNCMDGRELTPVVLLGAPLVGDNRSPVDQVFELTRVLTQLRPERLLRLAMPHALSIAQVIEAAMALGAEGWSDPPATDGVGRTVAGLKRALPPHVAEQVANIGQKLRERGTRPDLAAVKWLQAADLTGLRAGWILVGDVEACARMVAADGTPPSTLPPTQRLLDLVWSSVTEELVAVRRGLGLL
jgi:tetratricopeptide (TPR) repeat protein